MLHCASERICDVWYVHLLLSFSPSVMFNMVTLRHRLSPVQRTNDYRIVRKLDLEINNSQVIVAYTTKYQGPNPKTKMY